MTNKVISFRISTETYLKLEVIASEQGLSVSKYLQKKVEKETQDLAGDVRLMQSDIKEILNLLYRNNIDNNTRLSNSDDNNLPVLLEILMILREITQPAKLSSAQKIVNSQGYKIYNTLENNHE